MMPVILAATFYTLRFKLSAYSSVALAAIVKIADMAYDILLKWVFDQQIRVFRITHPAKWC